VVLGPDGGTLPWLATASRLGLSMILGSGRQWVSWIHIDDLVRLVEFSIDKPVVRSALNAASPSPVTQRQLQEALARTLQRPLWLRVPGFLLRLLLGESSQLLLTGQRAVPTRTLARGFQFRHRRLDEALRSLLKPAAPDLSSAEVYFNGDCPVCRFEMAHYAALCAKAQPRLRFVDATGQEKGLAACSLRREHLARRVYLRSADGRMLSGMSAIIAIWALLPRYRVLARICTMPVLRHLAALLYDHVLSPALALWARRRAAHGVPTTR
jgi:predicted DCC family thiol-disulfide oxidoreductase YuxK